MGTRDTIKRHVVRFKKLLLDEEGTIPNPSNMIYRLPVDVVSLAGSETTCIYGQIRHQPNLSVAGASDSTKAEVSPTFYVFTYCII